MSKLDLIMKDLQEVIGMQELVDKVNANDEISAYWGTAPTGKPHIGYLVPMIKIAHLLKANCKVTVLFADLHAFLDAMKSSFELLDHRTKYYEIIIKGLLECLNVDISKLNFVKGSDYQLTKEYTLDVYKLMSKITVDAAQKGGAEVVKQSSNPLLSGMIYPILQVLDEVYLKTDIQLGGVDQRKIFMMSRDHLHKIGYKSNIHLMNKMIPNLTGKSNDEKMSSSDINSKIDLLDNSKDIKKKINKAFLEPTNIDCPLFLFIQYVIFPIIELKKEEYFIINRDEKWGGIMKYSSFDELINEYKEDKISPPDIKLGVSDYLIKLLEPLRLKCDKKEILDLMKLAYI
jgi:tyrosyl-tRNA synthetase